MRLKTVVAILFINFVLSSNFLVNDNSSLTSASISFNIGEYSIDEKGDYKEILTASDGRIDRYGEPNLPQFSFNYAIENNKSYSVEYDILEYDTYTDINLYPAQKRNIDNQITKNNQLYSSDISYPNKNLEYTILGVNKTVRSVNSLLDSSSMDLKETVRNTKYITENLSRVSDTLSNANIGGVIRKAEQTLVSVNSLLDGIDQGKGSIGKLVNDDAMYNNLTNVSKELEELLREMKLNPKRFVHFSLFGKKAKAYEPDTIKANSTNIE